MTFNKKKKEVCLRPYLDKTDTVTYLFEMFETTNQEKNRNLASFDYVHRRKLCF